MLDCVALRCLIVDDNEAFLLSASRLLESQGMEIVGCVSSGDHAARLVEEAHPDVVLVDVQLGEESGLELARRLHAAIPETRVVLISTHPHDDLEELVEQSPAVGFLSKTALSAAAVAGLLA